jgi:hypothetical protein
MGNGVDGHIFGIYYLSMKTHPKRRGRPPTGSQDLKSASLLLKMSDREKRGFQEAAALAGAPLTVWIRERLRRIAAKELGEAGKTPAFYSELTKSA